MSDRTPLPPDELHDDDPRVASLVALQQMMTAPRRAESRDTLIAIAMAVYDHEVAPSVSIASRPASPPAPVHTVRVQPERANVSSLPVPPVSTPIGFEPQATVVSLDAARARRVRRMRVLTSVAAAAALAIATPLVLRKNRPTSGDPGVAAGVTTTVSTNSVPTQVTLDPAIPPPTATFDPAPKGTPVLDDHGIMALNAIPGILKQEMAKGQAKSLPVLPACMKEAIAALGGPPTHAFLAHTGSREVIVVGRTGKVPSIAALDITDCHNLMAETAK